ncbi:MAG: hypothetical protein FJY92_09830, partial [Candidatus Hydrogenedentes bacterium]|nr:hypothetical protein [Candidatus Hydrogenedentota bacterium]
MIRPSTPWALVAMGTLLLGASAAAVFAADDERGERAERGEKKVPLDSLPAAARDAIKKEAAGGEIEDIAEMTRNGVTFYEVDVVANGRETELHVGADGTLLGKKDEGEKRGGALAKAASKKGEYTYTFGLDRCTFSTTGKNAFFTLEPGYQLVLERKDAG